jgi:hypothetical protein
MNGKNGGSVVRHIEVRDALYFLLQVELVWHSAQAIRTTKQYITLPLNCPIDSTITAPAVNKVFIIMLTHSPSLHSPLLGHRTQKRP